jgi:group I intron endonuclease
MGTEIKSGIYQIVNRVNGKVYIGSAVDTKTRWQKHRYELNRQNHGNIHLQRAWQEYGADAFEFSVVEQVADPNDLITREQFWLDRQCAAHHGYNICREAGSTLGRAHSDETKAKIGAKSKGKIITAETRALISAHSRHLKPSPETIEKLREIHTGKIVTEETKARMSVSARKRVHEPHTDEAKARMSRAQTGHPVSDETKAKQSEAAKRRKGTFSSETRAAIGAAKVGNKYNVGRKASPEQRARNSAAQRQRGPRTPHSEETKAKMSVSARQRAPISEETRAKISANMKRIQAERRAAKARENQ